MGLRRQTSKATFGIAGNHLARRRSSEAFIAGAEGDLFFFDLEPHGLGIDRNTRPVPLAASVQVPFEATRIYCSILGQKGNAVSFLNH